MLKPRHWLLQYFASVSSKQRRAKALINAKVGSMPHVKRWVKKTNNTWTFLYKEKEYTLTVMKIQPKKFVIIDSYGKIIANTTQLDDAFRIVEDKALK